jgi:hypothetical protein
VPALTVEAIPDRSFNATINHRLLVNEVLRPSYQWHVLDEVKRLGLDRFETLLCTTARPTRDFFLTGQPPTSPTRADRQCKRPSR